MDRVYVVMVGNIIDGMSVIGTFEDYNEACVWAERVVKYDFWTVTEVISCAEYEGDYI